MYFQLYLSGSPKHVVDRYDRKYNLCVRLCIFYCITSG